MESKNIARKFTVLVVVCAIFVVLLSGFYLHGNFYANNIKADMGLVTTLKTYIKPDTHDSSRHKH